MAGDERSKDRSARKAEVCETRVGRQIGKNKRKLTKWAIDSRDAKQLASSSVLVTLSFSLSHDCCPRCYRCSKK